MTSARVLALLASCAMNRAQDLGHIALAPAAQTQDSVPADPALILAGLRELHSRREWNALAGAARAIRSELGRGSEAWFEASALLGEALYHDWSPAELEELGRDVRVAVMDSAGAQPGESFHVLGRLGPAAVPHALDVYVLEGWAVQARGDLEGAIALLWHVPEILLHGHVPPSRFTSRAGLDLGRIHAALGREEGRAMLAAVRDRFAGTDPAASAMVLLEWKEGASAYRGKYAGDERQAARMSALRAAIPRARARMARALGVEAGDLPEIPVGVVDRPQQHALEVAYTEGDPRRPAFPPVIVVFSETLALDLEDPEQLLAHELTHAVLLLRVGVGYERLPPWVREGLSNWAAGEFDLLVQAFLAQRLRSDPAAFAGPEHERLLEPTFEPRNGAPTIEEGLALSFLWKQAGDEGMRGLVRELCGGGSLDEALRAVSELSSAEYLEKAREHVRGLFREARRAARADLEALEAGRTSGVEPGLDAARTILERAPAPFVRGFASLLEARCLELLGRYAEAAAAYERRVRDSRSFAPDAEEARLGLARALIGAGRTQEARYVLLDLRRDALSPTAVEEAERLLVQLPR